MPSQHCISSYHGAGSNLWASQARHILLEYCGGGGWGGREGGRVGREGGWGGRKHAMLVMGSGSCQDTGTAVDSIRPVYVVEIHSDAGQTAGVQTCRAHLEQQA